MTEQECIWLLQDMNEDTGSGGNNINAGSVKPFYANKVKLPKLLLIITPHLYFLQTWKGNCNMELTLKKNINFTESRTPTKNFCIFSMDCGILSEAVFLGLLGRLGRSLGKVCHLACSRGSHPASCNQKYGLSSSQGLLGWYLASQVCCEGGKKHQTVPDCQ